MYRYDVYHIESCHTDLEDFLNEKAEQGFEAVSVIKIKHGYKIIFKSEKL